jgi:AsmA protein
MRLRTVLIAAGVVIGLPVIGLGVFVATFDANAYKPRIIAAAKEATGRDLSLNGHIGLKLGLHPALRVEDVAFANAPWGSRPEMAKLQALEVEVAVLPLLSGRVQINRIVLVRPDILLETDAEGRGNWEIAAPAQPQPSPPAQPQGQAPAPAQPQAGGGGRDIGIHAVSITDGTVAFRDGRTRQAVTLALPRFSARADSAHSPVSLDLAAALNGNAFTLAGTVGPVSRLIGEPGTGPWPVDLTASAAGARAAVKGIVAEPKTGKGYDLSVQASVPDLSRLAPFLPDVELPPARNIELAVQAADRGRRLPEISALTVRAGESDLNAFLPGLRLARLEVSAPDTRSPVRLALAATLNGAPVGAEGTLGPLGAFLPGASGQPWPLDLRLTAAGAQATAKGSIARPATPAGIDIAIAATVPDLAALSPLAGGASLPAIKDVTFSARAQDRRNGSGGILRDIALKLGPSDLEGDAELEIGARPKLTATLASQRFDLDQLLAAAGGEAAPGTAPAAPAAPPPAPPPAAARTRLIPDTPLPFAALRAADAALKLTVGELVFGGAPYRAVDATVALDRGKLSVAPFKATAPGAPVSGALTVDAARDAAPVAIRLSAPAIDLRQLLAAYGGGYRVGGTLELDIDVRGVGASPAAIAGTLDGHVGLAGANLDIDNRLIDLVAGEVWRALVPGAPREGTNNVRCLAFRFDSTGGTAEARAFLFDSALAKVAGTGSVLLGPEQLRLRAVPTLKLGSAGIGVPVLIGGTFLAPAVRVDPAGAAGAIVGALGRGQESGGGSSPLGAIAGALGGRQGGGQAGGAQAGGAQGGDDCPAQLAIARGGRAGAAAAPEAAPAAAPAQAPAQQQAPAQPQAPAPQQQPANPLQQLLPRLGR